MPFLIIFGRAVSNGSANSVYGSNQVANDLPSWTSCPGDQFLRDCGEITNVHYAIPVDIGARDEAGLAGTFAERCPYDAYVAAVDFAIAIDVARNSRHVCGRFSGLCFW